MHPILEDRRRLALYLLAWLLIGLLLSVGVRSDAEWTTAAAFLLPLCLVFAFIGLSTWYLCRAFPLSGSTSVWTLIIVQMTAAATASAIWTGLGYVWAAALDGLLAEPAAQPFYAQQRPVLFVVGALLYWLAAAGHYMLVAFQTSRDAETRAVEQTLLAREAELRALRAQIDPHFIFNSLHSISALTTTDAAAARTMCLLLADFLRDTLRLGSSSRISFADEWSLAERFLAIEQVRLGSRLNVARDSDPHAADCPVPPLLLQPLVENAVIHGIAQLVEGGTIRMTSHREGPTLTVTVENPCDPDRVRTRGVGLGLELLRQRLTTEFGMYDAVRAEERSGRFKVEVRIPIAASHTS
jgi:two-component system sensor histidine kinase AlgZ